MRTHVLVYYQYARTVLAVTRGREDGEVASTKSLLSLFTARGERGRAGASEVRKLKPRLLLRSVALSSESPSRRGAQAATGWKRNPLPLPPRELYPLLRAPLRVLTDPNRTMGRRLMMYTTLSVSATVVNFLYAWQTRMQFYPTVMFLVTSKASVLILGNLSSA